MKMFDIVSEAPVNPMQNGTSLGGTPTTNQSPQATQKQPAAVGEPMDPAAMQKANQEKRKQIDTQIKQLQDQIKMQQDQLKMLQQQKATIR